MRLARLAIGLSLLVLATACDRKPEAAKAPVPPPAAAAPAAPAPPTSPPLTGFTHDAKTDVQGYYMPKSPVKIGAWRLTNLTLGAPSDFSQWEANKRMATYGPVLLEFEDETSPLQTNEMGAEVHTKTLRVLPDSYRMDAAGVSFRGHAPGLGDIAFDGTFSAKTLAAAKAGNAPDGVVLRGALRIGPTEFRYVTFTYFMGD